MRLTSAYDRCGLGLMPAILLTLAACEQRPSTEPPDRPAGPELTAAIVSNPTASLPARAAGSPSLSGAAASDVAYISLPPGALPDAELLRIRNARNLAVIDIQVVDGGFEPFAVPASAGDTLDVTVRSRDGTAEPYIIIVPARRPPIVIRTDPAPKKRDVPLNATMLVVFSEPMDTSTVTQGNIHFRRAGEPVAITIDVSGDGLTIRLTPDRPLAPSADYRLELSLNIADLDGDSLEGTVVVDFTTADAAAPAAGLGLLAFGSHNALYIMNPDGSFTTQLAAQGYGPDWSPDGTHIAFSRQTLPDADGPEHALFVIRADGYEVSRLTTTGVNTSPAWSPDGGKIAFANRVDAGASSSSSIGIMNADGSGFAILRPGGTSPSWSPDGSRIAFDTPNVDGIWVMNSDGTAPVKVTSGEDKTPAWSPDGMRIAFARNVGGEGGYGIYTMSPSGTDVTAVATGASSAADPAWSGDGNTIAFTAYYAPGSGVYVVDATGSGFRRLIADAYGPAWSPVPAAADVGLTLQKSAEGSGDEQTSVVLTPLPSPLRVLVERGGVPAEGVTVYWNGDPGTSTPRTSTTNADGIASATVTLGQQAGVYKVEAGVSGATGSPLQFTLTADPGPVAQVVITQGCGWVIDVPCGEGQFGVANTSLESDYIAETQDAVGNRVSAGSAITWTVTSGGGAVGPGRGFRGCYDMGCYVGDAIAGASHTLGPEYGIQTVTASADGASPATFTAFAVSAVISVGWADDAYYCQNGFAPALVQVPEGTPIAWTWPPCHFGGIIQEGYYSREHDVVFEDGIDSSPARQAGYHLRIFTAPGTYRYRCTLHSTDFDQGEVGSVVVQP